MLDHRLTFKTAILAAGVALFATGALAQSPNDRVCPPDEKTLSPAVCFFTEVDFGGRYFCERGCRTVNEVDERWRNAIKSIEVRDGASVKICSEFDRNGVCSNIDTNKPELEPDLFNHVYSYRTKDE